MTPPANIQLNRWRTRSFALLLDSLRPWEPEHLDRLILYLGGSTWTLTSLIDAIRAYERKMNSFPPSPSSAHGSALFRHYQAKAEELSKHTIVRAYEPTTYIGSNRPTPVVDDPHAKRSLPNDPLTGSSGQASDNTPSLIQSTSKLSSVANTLESMNKTAPRPTSHRSSENSYPNIPRRGKQFCMRCGSPSHAISLCSI